MMRKGVLSMALVMAAGSGASAAPRMVVALADGSAGRVAVRIENAAREDLTLAATTYLTLRRPRGGSAQGDTPLLWAKIEASAVPTGLEALRLAGSGTSAVEVDPLALSWERDRSGLAPGLPLRRAVPPGSYVLQVRIVDDAGHWWRSGELAISVSETGDVRF
jgi:hypothetical protein